MTSSSLGVPILLFSSVYLTWIYPIEYIWREHTQLNKLVLTCAVKVITSTSAVNLDNFRFIDKIKIWIYIYKEAWASNNALLLGSEDVGPNKYKKKTGRSWKLKPEPENTSLYTSLSFLPTNIIAFLSYCFLLFPISIWFYTFIINILFLLS